VGRLLTAALGIAAAASLLQGQPPGAAGTIHFTDVTGRSGLSDFVLTCGSRDKRYILETNCGGLGFIDYDNDGWLDVYLVNGSTVEGELAHSNTAADRLYLNNRDGTFTDVTRQAHLDEHAWGMGVAIADVDNDGFDDIFVTNFGQNALYLNNGNGTFRDATAESGLKTDEPMWNTGAAFGDYDGDSLVDLFVTSYIDLDLTHLPTYDSMPAPQERSCQFMNMPVMCGPLGLKPSRDRLYHNAGGGKFVDVTKASGVGAAPAAFGLGVMWLDYDDDGRPDLYVANDRNPNFLFHNDGNGTFSEVALVKGAAVSASGREQAGMGVDAGDYDNDGRLDIVVTNFSEDYNTLYHNEGGHFTDVTLKSGTMQASYPYVGWGTKLADFDNDGLLDWIVADGHVFPQIDGRQTMFGHFAYRQPSLLFRNRGGGEFEDVSAASGVGAAPLRVNRGLIVGDIDNDGWLDVVQSALDEGPTVLMNRGRTGNWLEIKLHGTKSNRSAIGARVTARLGVATQIREVKSGDSYLSQSDQRVHFGLGSAAKIDELRIRWPSGRVQTLTGVAANRILELTEPAS